MLKSITLSFLLLLLVTCIRTPDSGIHYLSEIYYPELRGTVQQLDSSMREAYWVHLIDLGDREDFNAGHLPYSENIELKFFIDTNGYIVNNGKAITQRYDDRWEIIVYSSSIDTIAYWAARSIERLGFSRVRFYTGGPEDWQGNYGDFLEMNAPGFNTWYDSHYPFTDSLEVLVDVHPPSWFEGEDHLAGHIPGAVNIPAESLADTIDESVTILNEGLVLTNLVPDKSTRIVVYDSEDSRGMSTLFMAAAMELGYNNLFLFPGGYESWIQTGRELAR